MILAFSYLCLRKSNLGKKNLNKCFLSIQKLLCRAETKPLQVKILLIKCHFNVLFSLYLGDDFKPFQPTKTKIFHYEKLSAELEDSFF